MRYDWGNFADMGFRIGDDVISGKPKEIVKDIACDYCLKWHKTQVEFMECARFKSSKIDNATDGIDATS